MTPAEHAATVRPADHGLFLADLPSAEWVEYVKMIVALAERATELEAERDQLLIAREDAYRRLGEAEARATELERERDEARLAYDTLVSNVTKYDSDDERERAERAETALRMIGANELGLGVEALQNIARAALGETAPTKRCATRSADDTGRCTLPPRHKGEHIFG